MNLQVIVNESNLGKAGTDQIKKLQEKLNSQLQLKQKEIQLQSEKIKTQQGVVEERIIVGWGRDLERMQRDFQNAQQDAQVQVDQLTQDLLNNFEKQVLPVLEKNCFECHREPYVSEDGKRRRPKGGVIFESRKGLEKSKRGKVVVTLR